MKPIGILYLIDALQAGGAERQLLYLLNGLNRKLFKPYLLTWYGNHFYDNEYNNFQWIKYKRKHKLDFSPVIKAAQLLKKGDVQIVHGFLDTGNIYAFFAKLIAQRGIFVASERSAKRNLTLLQKIHKPISHKFANITVANSQNGINFIADLGIFRKSKTICIHNGLNMQLFNIINDNEKEKLRVNLSLPLDKRILICVGRVIPLKNQLGIVHAVSKINNSNLNVYFIGNGSNDYISLLEREITKLKLKNCIKIIEAKKEIFEWYQAADGFILNSNYEGSPNVIIEAMACGIPVISTDAGEAPYYLDSQCGWLIPIGNNEMLINAIQQFTSSSEEMLQKLGKNGRQKLVTLGISIQNMVNKYEKLYLNLVNQ